MEWIRQLFQTEPRYKKEEEPRTYKFKFGNNEVEFHYSGFGGEIEIEKGKYNPETNKYETYYDKARAFLLEDIEIITPEKKTFKISSLLPKDCKMIAVDDPEAIFAYGPDDKEVTIPINNLTNFFLNRPIKRQGDFIPEGALGETSGIIKVPLEEYKRLFIDLFHEIGHAHRDERKLINQSLYSELKQKAKEKGLTEKEKELYKKYVIQEEREAFAYALRCYRELKKSGINIAPHIKSSKELLDYIHYTLNQWFEVNPLLEKENIKEDIIKKY